MTTDIRINDNKAEINLKSIQILFAEKVKLFPNNVAVKFNNEQITYFELNNRSDILANYLHKLKPDSNPVIGIAIERSIDLIVAIFAIIKMDEACLPLDIGYPKNRLEFIIEDSGIEIILTNNDTLQNHPFLLNFKNSHLLVDINNPSIQKNTSYTLSAAQSNNLNGLFYILYTSGSTGMPKGVEMPAKAIANLITWQLTEKKIQKHNKTLQFSPISFDVSFQEIFSCLCAGETLVLMREELRKNPYMLYELIKNEKITHLFIPTVALQNLAEAAQGQPSLDSLISVITAGEQLKISAEIQAFFSTIPNAILYNHYGPTETHVVTSYQLSGPSEYWPQLPPIGFPIANVKVYILDKNNNQQKIGEEGELCLGGFCVAKGYHNRPDITNERFIQNPFAEGVIFKTGDLVKLQENGALKYLGRLDRQVKVRGYRIELAEVEIALSKHNYIQTCMAKIHEDFANHKILIAYLVLKNSYLNNKDFFKEEKFNYQIAPRQLFMELNNWLKQYVPEYMLPTFYILLRDVPLTPSGKTDYLSLPIPPIFNVEEIIKKIQKLNEPLIEKIIIVWEELLKVKPIAIDENFFDLGGNSLLILALNRIICALLNQEVPLTILFEYPTISSLAAYLSNTNELTLPKSRKLNINTRINNIRKNLREKNKINKDNQA